MWDLEIVLHVWDKYPDNLFLLLKEQYSQDKVSRMTSKNYVSVSLMKGSIMGKKFYFWNAMFTACIDIKIVVIDLCLNDTLNHCK